MMTVEELMMRKTKNTNYLATIEVIRNMANNIRFPYTDTLEINIDKEIMEDFSHIFDNDVRLLGLEYKAVKANDNEYKCVFYFKDDEIKSRREQAYLKTKELVHEIEKGQLDWLEEAGDKPFEVELEASQTLIPVLNDFIKKYGLKAIPNIKCGITVIIPKRLEDL
jgi:hypothetical protein